MFLKEDDANRVHLVLSLLDTDLGYRRILDFAAHVYLF